jgi:hypothetical protein
VVDRGSIVLDEAPADILRERVERDLDELERLAALDLIAELARDAPDER